MTSRTLPELIARQAARTPLAPAVVHVRGQLSYAGLAGRVDRLANFLHRRGVGPESIVGVCLHRGPELVVALLAVWRVGGAYTPLDPRLPAHRMAWLLGDTAASLVLTEESLSKAVEAAGGDPVCLDTDWQRIAAAPAAGPLAGATPDGAAYVIYTSGSTGLPKGVVVSHAGITNRVAWTVRHHGLGAADRVVQKTPLSFDAAGWEIYAPLISGGAVVMAPDGAERDPAELVRVVAEYRVTVLQVVPSVLRLLVEEPGWKQCGSVRLLFSAGEPLRAELCHQALAPLDAEVWNTYGPTECSIDVTAERFDPAQVAGAVAIGRPIDGIRALVLTSAGDLAPIGVPGELHVGGVGLARGYHNRPDLTAERFVPDPFGPPGTRLYRTGDRARWCTNGRLEYLGRQDQQVKINGVRVEPGEVESVLSTHPALAAAAVVAFTDRGGAPRLAAYVVHRGEPVAAERLRDFLRKALPEPLVPSVFVPLPALPLTVSGKVDRMALPSVEPHSMVERPPYIAPRTPAERTVARVWSGLLSVDQVGAHDDFFQLGGSSLLITRLARRVNTDWHREIPLREFFTASTVEAQAQLISLDHAPALPPLRPVARDGPLPLSFSQYRLWFLDRMQPGSPEWVTPVMLRLPAGTEPEVVQRALDALVARHEILRTRYEMDGADPRQVVGVPEPMPLRVIDSDRDDLSTHLDAEIARGFDLARGVVCRALLVRLPGEDHLLLVTVHHIASDGWSSVILAREINQLCDALSAGQEPVLPPLPVQYGDFAVWQRAQSSGDLHRDQLAYWRRTLAGMEPTELPTDRPRPAERDARGAVVELNLPPDLAGAVAELGRRHGATPFMVLLTAFSVLLARYTGRWDVAVGTPMADRALPEIEGTVGCFLNSVVLRCRLSGDLSFEEALIRVRETCRSAFAHRDVPFEHVVEELQPERDLSRTPLYQVMFEMVEEGVTTTALAPADREAFRLAWRTAKTDLTVYLHQEPDGNIAGFIEYAVGLFGGWVVRGLAEHFVRLVRGVVADAGVRVSVVGLLSAQEWGVVAAPAVGGVLVDGVSVGEVFARRVAVSPGAVAVVCGGVELTYGEVDERANRLAHCLRGLGVGPGSLVGVCVERGVDLVPALVGVVKSGGGYVPLDPAYPVDRLGFMLADTAASVVVTSAGLAARVAGVFSGSVVVLGSELVAGQSVAEPVPLAGGDDVLYVIYTSGSTGQPKGVQVTQANVLRLLACGRRLYGFDEADVWPLFHSYAFDVSVWELWGALLYGGRLVVVPFAVARAPEEFLDLLVQHRVTVLNQTPSAFGALVAAAAAGDPRVDELVLRLVVFAGEKLEIARLAPWVARRGLDAPVLANMYGITETTVHSTFHRITAADLDPAAGNPVGVPLADLGIYLLDPHGNPVPVGVPGEIYVGGPGVARGYLNRAELTAARFVPDPFGTPGTRLYRSGDLARRAADGSLQFLGRLDDQVKIRGYRIELGEIQAALRGHPQVTDAVVIAVEDTPGEHRLLAYLVPTAGAVLDPRSLRAHLAAVLPDYMLPARYLPVEHIPLTTNGKLDRKALPTADHQPLHPATSTPPRTPLEHRIATAWADILTLDHIGIHDNFFDAGGSSILALRISAWIRETFDLDYPVRLIFEGPTVAQAAVTVETRLRAEIAELSDDQLIAQPILSKELRA